MEGKSKSNLIFIIFTVIMLAFAVGGYFLGKKTAETENIPLGPKPVTPDNKGSETPTPEPVAYELKKEYSSIIEKVNYGLYIRDNNTFRFKVYGESGKDYVGTYEVNDSTVTFTTKIVFDTNGCYFKEGSEAIDKNQFESFTGTIRVNGISINHSGKTYDLITNDSKTEAEEAEEIYSLEPKTTLHTDCTSKGKV